MNPEEQPPQYLVAHLRRALAEDPRTSELGVRISVRANQVYLSGEVSCAHRRDDLEVVVREHLPTMSVRNDVQVVDSREPAGREELD
ncbi:MULTISPECIES: BON domain-containing protein [Rhodococcus]|uniref:BON domain-containing protein n=1 Tax=Rhodococcus oxybenzonivorans TaxID=1990687 RepID=A0AAE4V775_9NOCA|nr:MULTISPECIES: BON domain-containing protein [Rhodococcus]MDV7242362.1 BON domain-containing protein [Rhodococcus oxybenzonivorans]MDV7268859.1 BON domain-containing protein [Rhodococcus oxybenzonivorans]MDV7277109.1 BON domain-containing protein [Rhodococcus oxybenzonivorans]MDV7331851.1 BON domain-containing protein [Rhodococcus oxybenzonivorans]MDV7344072.1 BON domain-containing protein [Rhodococcus oxybenzonivorans]